MLLLMWYFFLVMYYLQLGQTFQGSPAPLYLWDSHLTWLSIRHSACKGCKTCLNKTTYLIGFSFNTSKLKIQIQKLAHANTARILGIKNNYFLPSFYVDAEVYSASGAMLPRRRMSELQQSNRKPATACQPVWSGEVSPKAKQNTGNLAS